MPKPVTVTRVTLEYVCEGKRFAVDFPNPSQIESIVFSKVDLHRLQAQQEHDTGPVRRHEFDPAMVLPGKIDEQPVLATSTEAGEASAVSATLARSLWWHTDSCDWFHPEEQ